MSLERQRAILENQLNEIMDGIAEMKRNRGDNFSIKQLEKTKKSIKQKLDKLNDQSRKDDVVTFEELGVDRLFVDEAHYYKNLAAFTKMRNVGGISQTEAMKSSDLYMKCRYLDELTGGKGVVFATGTPISNSTPTEIMQALELGITTVKFFPANVYGGLKALKALSAPFPQVKFIPTGGVDRSNIDEFLAFDKIAAIGGSFFVKEALEKMEAEK